MITGSVLAPFVHDSTWPDEVLRLFRGAVYYRYEPVSGRDPVNMIRELVSLKEKGARTDSRWRYLKKTCNKVVHLAVVGVSDGQMRWLVTNLLVFVNHLLIQDHGLKAKSSIRFQRTRYPEKNKADEASLEASRQRYADDVNRAYESLEEAIDSLRHGRGSLSLGHANALLSEIPSRHHLMEAEEEPTLVITLRRGDPAVCRYEFRPHDPKGWEMVGGSAAYDRFSSDPMSSEGIFGSTSAPEQP